MLILRITDDDAKVAVKSWWDGLTNRDRNEWLAIELEWKHATFPTNDSFFRSVSADWIEEHGGERCWWSLMNVDEISPSAAE